MTPRTPDPLTDPLIAPQWAGSPGFRSAWNLASAIPQHPSQATPEETQLGAALLGALSRARPIVCPPEQLVAIDDDLFPNLASAIDYARQLHLPFEHTYLDFSAKAVDAPPVFQLLPAHLTDLPPATEIRGMVASEQVEGGHLTFMPLVGAPGEPPEELGAIELWRDEVTPETTEIGRVEKQIETPFGTIAPPLLHRRRHPESHWRRRSSSARRVPWRRASQRT